MSDTVDTMRLTAEWTIVGVDQPDGVMVIASDDLSRSELDLIASRPGFDVLNIYTHNAYRLTTTMGSVVVTLGADYPEAVARLFAYWTPDPTRRPVPVLPPPPRAVLPR